MESIINQTLQTQALQVFLIAENNKKSIDSLFVRKIFNKKRKMLTPFV